MAERFIIENATGERYRVDDDGFALWKGRDPSFVKVGDTVFEADAGPSRDLESLSHRELDALAAARGITFRSGMRIAEKAETLAGTTAAGDGAQAESEA